MATIAAARKPSGASEESAAYRTGMSVADLKRSFEENLLFVQGRMRMIASRNDLYLALAYTVRDRMLHRLAARLQQVIHKQPRIACYLSAEFLLGPHLGNNLLCLGITEPVRKALRELGLDLEDLLAQEEEPGLGNGGLGRLAACFMDSLATLGIPAIGFGIRYEFGIFDQRIRDGWQVELTDAWLHLGNPWEVHRPEIAHYVKLGGHTEPYYDEQGHYRVRWVPNHVVKGVAFDTLVPGYRAESLNLLRLWKSEAVESFDFAAFNTGDYFQAVEEKVHSETFTKILYPNDEPLIGKKLRLAQQFFFVSCSLQEMLRLHRMRGRPPETLDQTFAAQLNDTHPSIAVAELMRLLVDEHGIGWERAWQTTQKMFAYTNHTLLPEALEKWPLPILAGLLPRHLEIIYEINRRFLDEVRASHPGDDWLAARVSLIDETGAKSVRMAHLACVGSSAINGVAALHSELLKKTVLKDFYELYPAKFLNVTNGVTPRRWIALSNPRLADLISSKIGDRWITHLEEELIKLERYAKDPVFCAQWRAIKRENKRNLAKLIALRTGITVDPESLFDCLVKRIHEYKRQHLQVLHIIALYNRIKRDPACRITPRTFLFGGKSAPGYAAAKLIIKLIHSVGEIVNHDPDVNGRLKVVFFPDFNVANAQCIYPAADLSEQISTAGKEASGTGNMKFAMNGALTIGTLDGANIEIREAVGNDNFFLFGLTEAEVAAMKASGYDPRRFYDSDPVLREVLGQVASGTFSHGDATLFAPLVDVLLQRDDYMLLADFQSYVECQDRAAAEFRDTQSWTTKSILNVARVGRFSSDRAIREYAEKIWKVTPVAP